MTPTELGKIKTPKKEAASRRNAELAAAARRGSGKSCNCGQTPHRYTCPVYKQEARRKSYLKNSSQNTSETP